MGQHSKQQPKSSVKLKTSLVFGFITSLIGLIAVSQQEPQIKLATAVAAYSTEQPSDKRPPHLAAKIQVRDEQDEEPQNEDQRHQWARSRRATVESSTIRTLHALVGQHIVIPCSNQTDLGASTRSVTAHSGGGASPPTRTKSRNSLWSTAPATNSLVNVANGQGVSLIVWHKDDQLNAPIFTVDARGVSTLREAKQQTHLEQLKGRLHLEESTKVDQRGHGMTPALVIEQAQMEDDGLYTCTIEFRKAAEQRHKIRLHMLDPPKNMLIVDHFNAKVANQTYDEDSKLQLHCEIDSPGEPAAKLTWWKLDSQVPLRGSSSPKTPHLNQSSSSWSSQDDSGHQFLATLRRASGDDEKDLFVAVGSDKPTLARNLNLQMPSNAAEIPPTTPKVRFWTQMTSSDSAIVDDIKRMRSSLSLSLSRQNQADEYICLAYNNNNFLLTSHPLNESVKIDLNLRPTAVKIVSKSNNFRLGQKSVVECQVFGARPSGATKIVWLKGANSEPIESSEADGNYIISEINPSDTKLPGLGGPKVSYLTFVPKISDNQQSLTCSAHNPKLALSSDQPQPQIMTDSITMNVQYPAQMSLDFGQHIKADAIKIGSDVFMDCNVQANPAIDELTWLFNDKPLNANVSLGVIMSNQSLALQRVKIEQRGSYQCVAQNSIGKSRSNKLEMRAKFEPICDYSSTKVKYEIAVDQEASIECNVLAEPGDDLMFEWKFNKSLTVDEGSSVASSSYVSLLEDLRQFETNYTKSVLKFRPQTRRHFGQLLCKASNSIGTQQRPCVIEVVPSELPEPVFGCFFDSLTSESFGVHCQAAASQGNSKQAYLLELYSNEQQHQSISSNSTSNASSHLIQREDSSEGPDNPDKRHVKRMTSDNPTFLVADLRPQTSYNVMIYVVNNKGRSQPAFYQTRTLPPGEGTEPGKVQFSAKRASSSLGDPTSTGFSDKFMSYLRSSGEFISGAASGNENSKPMIGIGLAVFLCTMSLVLVAFFTNKLCKSSIRAGQAVGPLQGAPTGKLDTYDKRKARFNENDVQLTPAQCYKGLAGAGSGSETSRETNTDSTLISSNAVHNRNAAMSSAGSASSGARQFVAGPNNNAAAPAGPKAAVATNTSGHCQVAAVDSSPAAIYAAIQRHQQQHLMNQNSADMDLSHTPQISIRSESDCTAGTGSHNETIQLDSAGAQVNPMTSSGGIVDSLYVMSHRGDSFNSRPASRQQQQIQILDPTSLWSYCSGADQPEASLGEATTQMSSVDEASLAAMSNCHFAPGTYLPSSMSIPIELSAQCSLHNNQSSAGFADDLCIPPATGGSSFIGEPNFHGKHLQIHSPFCAERQYIGGCGMPQTGPDEMSFALPPHALQLQSTVNGQTIQTLDGSFRYQRRLQQQQFDSINRRDSACIPNSILSSSNSHLPRANKNRSVRLDLQTKK